MTLGRRRSQPGLCPPLPLWEKHLVFLWLGFCLVTVFLETCGLETLRKYPVLFFVWSFGPAKKPRCWWLLCNQFFSIINKMVVSFLKTIQLPSSCQSQLLFFSPEPLAQPLTTPEFHQLRHTAPLELEWEEGSREVVGRNRVVIAEHTKLITKHHKHLALPSFLFLFLFFFNKINKMEENEWKEERWRSVRLRYFSSCSKNWCKAIYGE